MKKKFKLLAALFMMTVFLFYRGNAVVAIAAEQNAAFGAEPEAEQSTEPEAEQSTEPEAEQSTEPEAEQSTEPEAEQSTEPGAEQSTEPAAEQATEPAAEQATEPVTESMAEPDSEQATDSVSTGTALIQWLESHKNTGGTVKLADHVTLDGIYSISPDGMNKPAVTVEAGPYTITVAGEIEFLSDHHLTFRGQPDEKGIFYVAEKGMLFMTGVTVESGQCALWQEEGAGLSVSDCHISGSIHYAETPFVVAHSYNSACVILEKDQTPDDVLPTSINCEINRQGRSSKELVPVSWNLEETEKQQEKRQRFQIKGSFIQAASGEPLLCTVVYNDYPLTFTEVHASLTGNMYLFKGWYTKPEEALPVTVMSEYSFDGVNWFTDEEKVITDADATFMIAFPANQCEAAHSNIYIRLRCDDNGTEYFSNILCYAADNLEHVEDIGGSRGGGTSIVNPPEPPKQDEPPQQSTDGTSQEQEQPVQNTDRNIGSADTGQPSRAESGARTGQPSGVEPSYVGEEQSQYAGLSNAVAAQPLYAEAESGNKKGADESVSGIFDKAEEAAAAAAVYGENSARFFHMKGEERRVDIRSGNAIVLAAGIVLLSVIAGTLGFCVHTRRRAG